ncbi:hypothetical protein Tco_0881269 [Tanacetum coccineum]
MGDVNPIRTLGGYSKPSHEGYRNTIELPVWNNMVPLRSDTIRLVQNGCSFHRLRSEDPKQHLKDFLKLVDLLDLDSENRERTRLRSCYSFPCSIPSTEEDHKTPQRYPDVPTTSRRISLRSMDSFQGLTTKSPSPWHRSLAPIFFTIMSPFILNAKLTSPPVANSATRKPTNLGSSLRTSPSTTMRAGMTEGTSMAEMFGLLKELTTSRAPEKVLIREEAKSPVTKNVNSISLTRGEEENSDKDGVATGDGIEKTNGSDTEMPVKEAETENRAENRIKNKPIKRDEKEKGVEAPNSQPVGYYLKHMINEKLIEGLVDNHRFNDSLLGVRVGK